MENTFGQYMAKRYMVYVDRPVVIVIKTALVVKDVKDLEEQVAKHNAIFLESAKITSKPVKTKSGKIKVFLLSKFWDR